MHKIYLIGSLRNPQIPEIANKLRAFGYDVFDDWYAAGPEADDKWRDYEKGRGHTYEEALKGYAAKHVFEFDKHHLDEADSAILVMPAGKSAFLELGYCIGRGVPSYILLDNPERWDVMFQFAESATTDLGTIHDWINSRVWAANREPKCLYCKAGWEKARDVVGCHVAPNDELFACKDINANAGQSG